MATALQVLPEKNMMDSDFFTPVWKWGVIAFWIFHEYINFSVLYIILDLHLIF